ncbi:MAG: DUF4343 domain-containing protein [Bacteroidetes bacterium]|nr:MAG: DUF4343 domain-containing protein [Bacteroidota bacterium]
MKVHIQKAQDGEYHNVNAFTALDGFRKMGWEIAHYAHGRDLVGNAPDEVVVGFIDDVQSALRGLGVGEFPNFNYPEELTPFLGRKIWKSTVNTIANNPEKWGVFIKPVQDLKQFTGVLVRNTQDLIGCGRQDRDIEVWCSEPVHFLAEWRCFVRYGHVLDARPYKGHWKHHFDYRVIEEAVKAFTSAPNGYAIDFGVTDKGQTLLVEVNEGYSIGAYGLQSLDYAKVLSARWAQLTQSVDYCNF